MGREDVIRKRIRRISRWLKSLILEPRTFPGSGNYWENRYATGGNSGAGSYGKFADFKAEVLNTFVEFHSIQSVIEFGCGDGHQLTLGRYPAYLGVDVSRSAITQCRELFSGDRSKRFCHTSEYQSERADLAISLDVLYHLVEDDVFETYMRQLFGSADRYVIIYASDSDDNTGVDAHVRHRQFTRWIELNIPAWKRMQSIPNRYPYNGDHTEGSFADFHVYGLSEL